MKTRPLTRLRSRIYTSSALAIAGLIISLSSLTQAQVSPAGEKQFVQNGGFTQCSPGTQAGLCTSGAAAASTRINTPNQSSNTLPRLTGWTSRGLIWVYLPSGGTSGTTADTTGANSPGTKNFQGMDSPWRLWGPGPCTGTACSSPVPPNNVANGLKNTPLGGNFIALDSDQVTASGAIQGSITQAITGLRANVPVTVTFEWAGAQAHTYNFPTNDQLMVSLCAAGTGGASLTNPTGGCGSIPVGPPSNFSPGSNPPSPPGGTTNDMGTIKTTETKNVDNHGFNGWTAETFTFDPKSSDEILSFLARGNLSGLPPIVLLSGVQLNQQTETVIPEPSTWLLLGLGFAVIAGVAYRRRQWLGVPA